ncbi:MFS transporter [Sporosarcina sp. Marseille-Q4063]|uniref:MFS transporter n=1 Tax=Sporosarcina sp. Marseille-Q4063 TaxID=2810514 RepID=UPI00201649CC
MTVIIHANTTLELSAVSTGLILSFAGIGNIIGVLIMRYLEGVSWVPLLSILLIISASGVLLICLTSSIMMACIGMMIFDGALSMAFIVQAAVHQGITPDNALSRVRSSTYVIGGLFAMLGSFLSGAIPQFYSTNMSLVVGFAILAVPSIIILRYKKRKCRHEKNGSYPIKVKRWVNDDIY